MSELFFNFSFCFVNFILEFEMADVTIPAVKKTEAFSLLYNATFNIDTDDSKQQRAEKVVSQANIMASKQAKEWLAYWHKLKLKGQSWFQIKSEAAHAKNTEEYVVLAEKKYYEDTWKRFHESRLKELYRTRENSDLVPADFPPRAQLLLETPDKPPRDDNIHLDYYSYMKEEPIKREKKL